MSKIIIFILIIINLFYLSLLNKLEKINNDIIEEILLI